jgi:hypothetical protein
VIILVVEHVDVSVAKLELESPIAAYGDGPPIALITLQGVQPKVREIRVVQAGAVIEGGKLNTKSVCLLGLRPRLGTCREERFQPSAQSGVSAERGLVPCFQLGKMGKPKSVLVPCTLRR